MKKKGFTLVELLVVIAILAILATVSIVGYTQFIAKSKQSVCLQEATQVRDLLIAEDINNNMFEVDVDDNILVFDKCIKWNATDGCSIHGTDKTTAHNYEWKDLVTRKNGTSEAATHKYNESKLVETSEGANLVLTEFGKDLGELVYNISVESSGIVKYNNGNGCTATINFSEEIKVEASTNN